jgi:hypothetical protein
VLSTIEIQFVFHFFEKSIFLFYLDHTLSNSKIKIVGHVLGLCSVFRLLMIGIVIPETCSAVSVRQSNKILRLIVASSWLFYLSD